MKGSEPGKMFRQSAQNCTAVIARADSRLPGMVTAPEWNEVKSLIARCFTSLGEQGNAEANPRDFPVLPEPAFCPSGMNSAPGKGVFHRADSSLSPAGNFCKTGVRPGIEGRFGKRLPDVGPHDSPDFSRLLFSAGLSRQPKEAKPGTQAGNHFVFTRNRRLSTTPPPDQSNYPTRAFATARHGERRNEE